MWKYYLCCSLNLIGMAGFGQRSLDSFRKEKGAFKPLVGTVPKVGFRLLHKRVSLLRLPKLAFFPIASIAQEGNFNEGENKILMLRKIEVPKLYLLAIQREVERFEKGKIDYCKIL